MVETVYNLLVITICIQACSDPFYKGLILRERNYSRDTVYAKYGVVEPQ